MSGRGGDEGGYRPFSGAYGRLGNGKGVEGRRVINETDFGTDNDIERALAKSREEAWANDGVGTAASSGEVVCLDRDVFERVYLNVDFRPPNSPCSSSFNFPRRTSGRWSRILQCFLTISRLMFQREVNRHGRLGQAGRPLSETRKFG